MGGSGLTAGAEYANVGVPHNGAIVLWLDFMEVFQGAFFAATGELASADPGAQKTDAGGSASSSKENGKKEQKEKEFKRAIEQAEAVRLVYHIHEGPQTQGRRLLIAGWPHNRPGVVPLAEPPTVQTPT